MTRDELINCKVSWGIPLEQAKFEADVDEALQRHDDKEFVRLCLAHPKWAPQTYNAD